MNKYQQFAVNHYLSGYEEDSTYDDILHALRVGNTDAVDIKPFYDSIEGLSLEEIADDIEQMAFDLERCL